MNSVNLKASVSFVGDGSTNKFYFGFDYINKQFVKVQVGADSSPLTYLHDYTVDDRSVTLTDTPAVGVDIRVYRETPSDRIVEWADGAFIKASQMTLESLQQLHLIEESHDYPILNSLSKYPDGVNFNALGSRVVNVRDPEDPQDVVTKRYMENVQDGFIAANTKILNEAKDTLSATQQTQSKAQTNETLSKAWATSTESPDNADDTHSSTGMTQSSRSWALYSEGKAQEAATSEAHAKTSETNAKTSETEALASERNAMTSEANAKKSATEALESERNAMTSETNAKASATNAKTSETNAKASEVKASASEANAKTSETHAKDFATNASISLANAIGSENNARDSEMKAATSEAHAKTSETNAKDSETKVATSEANAKVSEINAKTSETNARASETQAVTSANAAKVSETNAAESARIATEYGRDFNMLKRNKTYSVGDIAYSPSLPSWAYLECITAGITGYTEPDFSGVSSAGEQIAEITDGSATFVVRKSATKDDIKDITKQTDSALYFHKGDSFKLNELVPAAFITTGKTRIHLSIVLPKRIGDDVNTIVAQGMFRCRQNNNYIAGSANDFVTFKTNTKDIVDGWSENILNISLFYNKDKTEYPNSINNDTVGLQLNNVDIKFT